MAKRVLIAGGGVAALEAALTLQELAPDLVQTELIAPEPRFWYRPLSVAEPFGLGEARSFDLADLAGRAGALFVLDELTAVEAGAHVARTRAGAEYEYDSLLLACGAVPKVAVAGALTFRGPADTALVAELVAQIDAGDVTRVAVAVPLGAVWSLPAYELALMLAAHADAVGADCRVALVTPEDEPLLLFGSEARDAIRALLDQRGIALHTGYFPTDVHDGELHLLPARTLEVDRVLALPTLHGPRIDGVPQTRDGFVVTDPHGRVDGLTDVYAAGDLTRFPVKQGGLAAQQADAAAESIAAASGADVEPHPFRPVLRGVLLTGGAPRYLRRDVGRSGAGTVSVDPLWWPPAKLVGRRLAPFLASLADTPYAEPTAAAPDAIAVEVEVEAGSLEVPAAAWTEDEPDDDAATVGDLMTEALVVAPEDTLGEVAERMSSADVGSVLVADYGRLIGILTSRDLLRAFAGRVHSSEARVREWMTADPIAAAEDTSAAAALLVMTEHAIHHLPVVEGDRAKGIVGIRAVARAAADRPRRRGSVGLGY